MNEGMPDEFWQGVEQFNAGQYYACHDTLEALWIEATEPEKTFYQGILQIAVALYHLSNHNLRGAMILLGEGSNRLRRYPSQFGGIDVDEVLSQSAALLTALQQTPENITAFNLGQDGGLPLPRIIQVNHEKE
ncbi:DUF309 domain-containing protein [Tolypothrix campylonemoides VB511288]|nr:DUF309 domain-containing protein [Tolypothrix campylonemoides VB511288]